MLVDMHSVVVQVFQPLFRDLNCNNAADPVRD